MAERVVRIAIDSVPAEAGARRVVRSLDAIARKSRETVAEIGKVESALLRLRRAAEAMERVRLQAQGNVGRLGHAKSGIAPADGFQGATFVPIGMGIANGFNGDMRKDPALHQAAALTFPGGLVPHDAVARSFGTDDAGLLEERNLALEESLSLFARLEPEIEAAAGAQDALNRSLEQGARNSRELGEGAERAFADYAEAATDAGAQIEQAIGGALGGLETALVGFVQTGKLEWTSLVDSMIADLIRLFIRAQVLGPLAQGLGGLFSGGGGLVGSYAGATFTARGAAFEDGRRLAFARGGVVARPTLFPLAQGTGLMGEAGPEAILPLKRLPGGDLGVRAAGGGAVFNQTIVNEAGVEIETEERPNATGGIDQLLVLIRRDAERQMVEGRLGRVTAERFGLSERPVGR